MLYVVSFALWNVWTAIYFGYIENEGYITYFEDDPIEFFYESIDVYFILWFPLVFTLLFLFIGFLHRYKEKYFFVAQITPKAIKAKRLRRKKRKKKRR